MIHHNMLWRPLAATEKPFIEETSGETAFGETVGAFSERHTWMGRSCKLEPGTLSGPRWHELAACCLLLTIMSRMAQPFSPLILCRFCVSALLSDDRALTRPTC